MTNHIVGNIINAFQLVMKCYFPVMDHSEAEIKVVIRTVARNLGYIKVRPVHKVRVPTICKPTNQ